MKETDVQKINKQTDFRYYEIITKFINLSYIALALILMGTVLLFTILFAYLKPGLGICIFLLFIMAGILVELINGNLTWLKITEIQMKEPTKKSTPGSLANLYKYSFIVYTTAIIACVYLLPFFTNFNYTKTEYYGVLPLVTTLSIFMGFLLRAISHIYMKNSEMYQIAGTPLYYFSKRAIYLPIVLLIVTFDTYIIKELLIQIIIGFPVLILNFCGILYLTGHHRQIF
ncbi:MAG: hypothetical protein WCD89_10040 [Anaerocolumna sp.]